MRIAAGKIVQYAGRALLLGCGLLIATTLTAAEFQIVNLDGPGEGFNDPTPAAPVGGNTGTTLGEQRLKVFERAGQIWGAAIGSPVPILIEAEFNPLTCSPGSAILGSAAAINVIRDFTNAPVSNTWYHSALANALAGTDLITPDADVGVELNGSIDNNNNCLSGINWYLGLDGNSANNIDLLIVLLHELGHGLGFSGFTNLTNGAFLLNRKDVYSLFTLDNSTGTTWNQMNRNQRRNSATNTGQIVWNGPNVNAGAGALLVSGTDGAGNPRLYAPSPLELGSSISHFDTVAFPNLLMEPFINASLGPELDLTLQQMLDVGWLAASADLSISVTESADPLTAGDPLDLTVTVTNNGPDPADGVMVNTGLSGLLLLTSTSGCSEDPMAVPNCSLGFIPANSNVVFTITTDTLSDGNAVSQLTVSSSTSDSVSANDVEMVSTTIDPPCTDSDGDGVCDPDDNCPQIANPLQEDLDSDDIGDVCDDDRDGDGVLNENDAFPDDPAETTDTDDDGIGNNADPDDDNDGVPDEYDHFPLDPLKFLLPEYQVPYPVWAVLLLGIVLCRIAGRAAAGGSGAVRPRD